MMNFTDDSKLSRSIPFEIDWMTRMPSSAAQTVPRPPNRLVPPMTAAAIALSNTSPPPADWLTASRRDAARTPPRAAKNDAIVNTAIRTRSTLIPARRAASALPPTAKIIRPNRVRLATKSMTTMTAMRMTSDSGRPRAGSWSSTQIATATSTAMTMTRIPRTTIGSDGSSAAARLRRVIKAVPATYTMNRAPSPYATAPEKNVPARLRMNPSLRLSVPVAPSTNSSAPCQAIRPASVTTNAGIRNLVIHRPWKRPMATPTTSADPTAIGPGTPIVTLRTAITADASPLTMPTVKSISPSSSTNTTPTAIVPVAALWSARFVRLNGVRNELLGEVIVKIVQMRTSPMMTGSWPTSPEATRRR